MIIASGTIVDGKYQILEQVSAGGMGTIYSAIETELNRKVALKFLHENLLSDPESLARFNREAELLSKLDHPGVATIFRYGCLQLSDSVSHPFIAMEFVEGKSLRMLLHERQTIQLDHALDIVAQICNAIEHAHKCGVVHRDLKPDNVMLTDSENTSYSVKIIDFGLGKIVASDFAQRSGKATLTETGLLVGSVHYMSPEQCSGKKADYRSDVYSIGCILFEVLTDKVPFSADSPMGIIYKHGNEQAPQLPPIGPPAVTTSLNAVIGKALAKRPEDRYESVAALASDVLAVRHGKEVKSRQQSQDWRASFNKRLALSVAATALTLGVLTIGVLQLSNKSNVTPAFGNSKKNASYYEERVRRVYARLSAASPEDRTTLAETFIKYVSELQSFYWRNGNYEKALALDEQKLFAARFVADPRGEFLSAFETRSNRYREMERKEQNPAKREEYHKHAVQALENGRAHYAGANLPEQVGYLSQTVMDFNEDRQFDRARQDLSTLDSLLSTELRWRVRNSKLDASLKVLFNHMSRPTPQEVLCDEEVRHRCELLLQLASLSEVTKDECAAVKKKAAAMLSERLATTPESKLKHRFATLLKSAQEEAAGTVQVTNRKKSTAEQLNSMVERHLFFYGGRNEERKE